MARGGLEAALTPTLVTDGQAHCLGAVCVGQQREATAKPPALRLSARSWQGVSLGALVDSEARTGGDASVAHRSRSVEPHSCLRTAIVSVAARDEHPATRQRRHGRELPGEFVGP